MKRTKGRKGAVKGRARLLGLVGRAKSTLKRLARKQKKVFIKFDFDKSFYTFDSNKQTAKNFANFAAGRALGQLALDVRRPAERETRAKIAKLMQERVDLYLTTPVSLKHLNKLQKRLNKIDIKLNELITGSKGPEEAKRFASLLIQYSKRKPEPEPEKKQQ